MDEVRAQMSSGGQPATGVRPLEVVRMALSGRPGTDQSPTMLGTLAPDEIEELLSTEAVGRIGCIHEGRTYVVPVC